MKLLFKQRFFSWFDSYDIYDEAGNTVYVVKGELSWGHLLRIYDAAGNDLGMIKEKVLTWLPKFEMYLGERYIGCISKEFSFFKPRYNIDCNGWQISGWNGTIRFKAPPVRQLQRYQRKFGIGPIPMRLMFQIRRMRFVFL